MLPASVKRLPGAEQSCILNSWSMFSDGAGLMGRDRPAGPESNKHRPDEGGELALLARIRARAADSVSNRNLRLGIGDDCALVSVGPGEEIAVTTDLSIAGRHFELAWHPAEAIGRRVLARGLSDLAAMGARPIAAFLSLGIPKELVAVGGGKSAIHAYPTRKAKTLTAWIDRFYDGLFALASEFDTPLAGGDLAESPIAAADIILVGAVTRGKALLRSDARPGDAIYVTGSLGGAAAGLEILKALAGKRKGSGVGGLKIPIETEAALAKHLYPQPRVRQGLWLARRGVATAAIDVSDGLSTDLRHLCEESGVAAELDAVALPVSAGTTLEQALHGGEDYELLFTARPNTCLPRKIAGVEVTRIGRIARRSAKKPLVTLVTPEGRAALVAHGWQHFA
ncbi:MAG: thiamine-phosphate kinase [Terracidiphilus sp.]